MKRQAENEDAPQAKKAHWAMGLLNTMRNPKYVVKTDSKVTIIKDMYPKARHHFLVLPNADVSGLKAVDGSHADLLRRMEKSGRKYVKEHHSDCNFLFGYHAEASMHRLHLHVISDDFDSPCMKTKKHWNTFTTEFFIAAKDVAETLERHGKVELPTAEKCKDYLERSLKCHKCDYRPKHMPDLKKHIRNTHLK